MFALMSLGSEVFWIKRQMWLSLSWRLGEENKEDQKVLRMAQKETWVVWPPVLLGNWHALALPIAPCTKAESAFQWPPLPSWFLHVLPVSNTCGHLWGTVHGLRLTFLVHGIKKTEPGPNCIQYLDSFNSTLCPITKSSFPLVTRPPSKFFPTLSLCN